MKSILLTSSLLITIAGIGQIEKEINHVLLKADFVKFLQFANTYERDSNNVRIAKGNIREIKKGFEEAVFYISKAYPVNKAVSITCNPRLHIIKEGNQIIYFYLEAKEMKGFPNNFEITSDTTYNFIDRNGMARLRAQFEVTYHTLLNESELFVDTIAVGDKCGRLPGRPTTQQEQILSWVKLTDTANLYKWLQSPNAEKQVYAIKGFYLLSLKGIKISEQTKAVIRHIRRKRGTITTCIPCDSGRTEISEVLKPYTY